MRGASSSSAGSSSSRASTSRGSRTPAARGTARSTRGRTFDEREREGQGEREGRREPYVRRPPSVISFRRLTTLDMMQSTSPPQHERLTAYHRMLELIPVIAVASREAPRDWGDVADQLRRAFASVLLDIAE